MFARHALAATLLLAIGAVHAAFPEKKLEMVTHSGAGGGTDLTARMVAKLAEPLWGQSVVILNKRGGGGALSLTYLDERPADGYTILTYTSGQAAEVAKGSTKTTLADLIPIARATDDPQILMTKCGRFADAQAFVAAQKDKAMTYGTTHLGGIDDVSAFTFTQRGGLQTAEVIPFDSGNEIATQIVAGGVDVGVLNLGEARAQIEAGKVCPLVVLADARMAALPEVSTAQELGIPVSLSTVRGFVVKAGTPPEVVKAIEDTLLAAMQQAEYREFLQTLGLDESSVAGSEVWGKQLQGADDDMRAALKQLGFIP